jgi:response regulator RpfG family c-di-GMP phosphodiesterase
LAGRALDLRLRGVMESRYKEHIPPPIRKGSRVPAVVLVDDDKRVIELLELALSGSGYRTFSALDGDEAISLTEKVRPDVVVLDVRLPKKNGYQVCEALKANPLTESIPVIMISGLVEPSARVQGLRCGADDFLTKPFSPKELLLRIQKILLRASEAGSVATAQAEAHKLLQEKQKRLGRAQRKLAARVDRVSALAEMGRTMTAATTVEELADQMIVSLQICLRAGSAIVALRDDDGGDFKIVKYRGVSSRRAEGVTLAVDGRLAGALSAGDGPMTLQELDGVPGMRSEIVPLRACGIAMGVSVEGTCGPAALIFIGAGLGNGTFMAEDRQDLGALCRFFSTGLSTIQRIESAKAGMIDAVEMLVRSMESSGDRRGGHSRRVARFAETIWESLDLPPYELQDIRLAALLHEIEGIEPPGCSACELSGGAGECGCSASDPSHRDSGDAPGCRTDEPVMRRSGSASGHSGVSAALPSRLAGLLRHSSERYDGSGGPLGLRAEQIPLEARILAVADTFDECLCRCGSPLPVDEAIRGLRKLAGTSLDPNLVEALIHHILNGRVRLG